MPRAVEYERLLAVVRSWPKEVPHGASEDVALLLRANREILANETILAAARYLLVDHYAGTAVLPVVGMLIGLLDVQCSGSGVGD